MRMGADRGRPGRLRIVAGNWRSRLVPVADVKGLRPTSERIRETLFNWIGPRIEGQRCLDLFAGSGALGLEALSRGAREVVFVEQSATAIRSLKSAKALLDATGARIVTGDAWAWLRDCATERFDLVFLDPPFADESLAELCRLIDERHIMKSGGRVYLEQDRKDDVPELPEGWEILRSKTAGNVRYSLVST